MKRRPEPEPVDRVPASDVYRYMLDPNSIGDPSPELLAAVAEGEARHHARAAEHRHPGPTGWRQDAP